MCAICGDPFSGAGPDHLCHRCLSRRPSFGVARACTIYRAGDSDAGPLARAIHRYKYTPDIALAPTLGRLLAKRTPGFTTAYDLIIPIPLHINRLRWRGFNQAQLLARPLARMRGVPIDPFAVERSRATTPQVELDVAARRRNVIDAFRVPDARRVRGRSILLVDDIYTTGATANECTRTLRRAGAVHVDVLVLARAVLR